jgi:toxin ParE1/3/4
VITLFIGPKAGSDLLEIEDYSVRTFGADKAANYMTMIERVFYRLLNYPESGPVYPGLLPAIRYVSVGKHRAFYDYDGRSITVVRVLHQAMVPEDHF